MSIETGLENYFDECCKLFTMKKNNVGYINFDASPIISIEECGEEDVMDITTDGNHLFYANGILTHNSGYDTSDVSMKETSESAGINFHADFIGALYQIDGDAEANKMNMVILKNRLGGKVGKVLEFFINYKNLQLSDYCDEVGGGEDDESAADAILNELNNL